MSGATGYRWVQGLRQSYVKSLGENHQKEVVLVTGAYGQIGRDFMPILRQLFGESNVIASDIAKPTASKVVETYDNLKTIELDVCDKGAVRDAVKTFKVTRIVHLATMLSAVGEKLPIKGRPGVTTDVGVRACADDTDRTFCARPPPPQPTT